MGALGAAALAGAVAAIRNMRAVPLPGAVPPPPPSRPPERPKLDEAPRPASELMRPQVSQPESRGTKRESEAHAAGHTSTANGERPEGTSEGSAAASSSPRDAAVRPGGELASMSREELYAEARRRNLPGRSRMSKEQLIRALSGT
jgi:hypothetical protein